MAIYGFLDEFLLGYGRQLTSVFRIEVTFLSMTIKKERIIALFFHQNISII